MVSVRMGPDSASLRVIQFVEAKPGSCRLREVLWQRGHKYLTVVNQIDSGCKWLLWVGKDRTIKTVLRFFRSFGKERSAQLRFADRSNKAPF